MLLCRALAGCWPPSHNLLPPPTSLSISLLLYKCTTEPCTNPCQFTTGPSPMLATTYQLIMSTSTAAPCSSHEPLQLLPTSAPPLPALPSHEATTALSAGDRKPRYKEVRHNGTHQTTPCNTHPCYRPKTSLLPHRHYSRSVHACRAQQVPLGKP